MPIHDLLTLGIANFFLYKIYRCTHIQVTWLCLKKKKKAKNKQTKKLPWLSLKFSLLHRLSLDKNILCKKISGNFLWKSIVFVFICMQIILKCSICSFVGRFVWSLHLVVLNYCYLPPPESFYEVTVMNMNGYVPFLINTRWTRLWAGENILSCHH